jgi:hypothetical protein
MNPFLDYMNLLKQGVKNADKIIEGISTKTLKEFNLLNEDDKQRITGRMDICLNCPYNSRNAKLSPEYLELTGHPYSTGRTELHCALCGCVAEFKTACLTCNCGVQNWNELHPDKKLELKWTKKP